LWRSLDLKATSQAGSDQDAIDHPEIIGGKGIYQQESAADAISKHCAVTQCLFWLATIFQVGDFSG
jgi:hypothetical protein